MEIIQVRQHAVDEETGGLVAPLEKQNRNKERKHKGGDG